jgi:hypothetical protein
VRFREGSVPQRSRRLQNVPTAPEAPSLKQLVVNDHALALAKAAASSLSTARRTDSRYVFKLRLIATRPGSEGSCASSTDWPGRLVRRRALNRAALLGLAAAALGPLLRPAWASEREVVRLGLAIHVAREEGEAVADEAFIDRQVETANRIFAPYGVQLERRERHERDARAARMETRAERDALGAFVRPHWINVFVVASLMDVDEPQRVRRGVHWHSISHAPAHYVILSRISFDAVLAHELGHFLGNPRHSETPGNLMSYHHTEVLPFLDEPQQQRLHRSLAAYLRTGELRRLRADGGAGE